MRRELFGHCRVGTRQNARQIVAKVKQQVGLPQDLLDVVTENSERLAVERINMIVC